MKRSQQGKEQSGSSSWREGQPYTCFFQGGPPAKYGGRQGKNPFPYAPSFRKRNRGGAVGHTTTSMAKATNRDYHREIWNHEHKGGSETFKFFTSKRSEETGSRCGLTVLVVEKEADQPVGGWLQFFRHNWEQISRDPWILETILGCRLEFSDSPYYRNELTQVPWVRRRPRL